LIRRSREELLAMATLHFLGTASALPTAERTNTALAVTSETPGRGVLIDCGGSVYERLNQAHIAPDALGDLFITHAHIDHIGSLPSLIEAWRLAGRSAALRIVAIPEVLAVARRLVGTFDFELTLDRWSFDVTFDPVENGHSLRLGEFDARALRMDHAIPSAGVRLELPRGPVAYTCDTQPAPAVLELARDARMMITECTFLHRYASQARFFKHSTAFEAGEEAGRSGVAMLGLVHVSEGEDWTTEEAQEEAARSFGGEVLIPHDLDTLEV
jgi:ribonuclease Z